MATGPKRRSTSARQSGIDIDASPTIASGDSSRPNTWNANSSIDSTSSPPPSVADVATGVTNPSGSRCCRRVSRLES